MQLNIINAKENRTERLLNELATQGIIDYKLWPGVFKKSVKESINLAHKQIVEWAFENDLPEVCIAEDDLKATHRDSWKFFLANKPHVFDLYLASIFLGDLDEQNMVKDFTGPTLYVISRKFYPTFLTLPDDEHIDHALTGLGDYHVCFPFTFIQHDGISSNTGKHESYGQMFKFRNLFAG